MDEYKRRRRRSRAVMSMFLDSLGGSIDNVDVATFDSDGTDLKALVVSIEPIQDLHGYDNPWPAGGGKNKFDVGKMVNTASITISNGTIIVSGNANNSTKKLSELADLVVGETYTLTAATTGTQNFIYLYGTNTSWYFGNQRTITEQDLNSLVFFYGGNDSTSNITDFMIRLSSVSDATFAPYSNECPISGHSSVNVIVSPTLNPLDGTITNIPLGGTYYGGQLDVLPGVLTVTHANISSYNGDAINEPWISSMDAYSPGATPTTGAQVVYPLATPQTIQLTGQQISTFLGTNNVWCDSGKIIHLEY